MIESQVILSRLTDALEKLAAPNPRKITSSSSTSDSFACRNSLPVTALALSVDATGSVRLPISMTRARKLTALTTPAPFGKGRQTLHDKRVRDVGEIPRRRLDWNGRDWHRTLKPVLEEMRAELGLPDGKLSAKYAFYADCEHEVHPVNEGYRIVQKQVTRTMASQWASHWNRCDCVPVN